MAHFFLYTGDIFPSSFYGDGILARACRLDIETCLNVSTFHDGVITMHKSDFDTCTGILVDAIRNERANKTGYGSIVGTVRSLLDDVPDSNGIESVLLAAINQEYDLMTCRDDKELRDEYGTFRKTIQREAEAHEPPFSVSFNYKGESRTVSVQLVTREYLETEAKRKAEDKARNKARKAEDKAFRDQMAKQELARKTDEEIAEETLQYLTDHYGADRVIPAVSSIVDKLQNYAINREYLAKQSA